MSLHFSDARRYVQLTVSPDAFYRMVIDVREYTERKCLAYLDIEPVEKYRAEIRWFAELVGSTDRVPWNPDIAPVPNTARLLFCLARELGVVTCQNCGQSEGCDPDYPYCEECKELLP